MEQVLHNYIQDTENGITNFNLACAYFNIGQTSAAISYFLRAAERLLNKNDQYAALLMIAECFNLQKNRNFSTISTLQQAISLLPNRPEAYYLLSLVYATQERWMDSYMILSIGVIVADIQNTNLCINVGYPGKYALMFQYGLASWWIGLPHQAKNIFYDLKNNYTMDQQHITAIENNINDVLAKLSTP